MSSSNMAAITASLERSLQNCSINGDSSDGAASRPAGNQANAAATVELNSHISLPYQWEQCLDLKTGEVYYINWRNGTKAKEDPRKPARYGGNFYSEEDREYSSDESEASWSSQSPSSNESQGDHVLVVAGCKSCMMYFMLPKRVVQCPKCSGLLLHFDRSDENENEDDNENDCL